MITHTNSDDDNDDDDDDDDDDNYDNNDSRRFRNRDGHIEMHTSSVKHKHTQDKQHRTPKVFWPAGGFRHLGLCAHSAYSATQWLLREHVFVSLRRILQKSESHDTQTSQLFN